MTGSKLTTLEYLPDLLEDLLSVDRGVRVKATGTSMYPAIAHGDLVLVTPVRDQLLRSGQVIVFRKNNRCIAHRIISQTNDGRFITGADFYSQKDDPVSFDQILGIVVKKWRGGNHHLEGTQLRRRSPLLIRMKRPLFKLNYRFSRI